MKFIFYSQKLNNFHETNDFYLQIASKKVNRAIEIEYYLKPILFPEDVKPLAGMEIVISTYSGDERLFLGSLAEIMGGNVQDAYKKSQRPLLICPAPDNAKYNAALKWSK